MKNCPFCLGPIPVEAMKCQHCGEWVDGRVSSKPVDDLARAAQRMMSLKFRLSVIGSIVVLILALLFFFLFWLPQWNKMNRRFENFPGSLPSPQVLPKNP